MNRHIWRDIFFSCVVTILIHSVCCGDVAFGVMGLFISGHYFVLAGHGM